ncbi:MAG TPA: glycosyltransferase 87 family protein [Stellaceae bacterium]|nr:glycosyltransferase 87 family protein [Stellaceae bacterium]
MTRRWRLGALIACGGGMLVLTGVGLLLQGEDALDAFIVVALAEGAIYLIAARLAWGGGFSRRVLVMILAVAALMRVAVVLAPPYLSSDLYRYIWDGRVQAAGINPYRYIPIDPHLAALRDPDIFPNINRNNYARTIYPPVAEALFLAITRVSETLTWMKASMAILDVGAMLVLLRLLILGALPPERILLYAWHPLAVWEFAGSGHVDAALVLLLALALWARRRESAWLTGLSLGAAVLVKLFPVALVPAFYRRWDWKLPATVLAVIVLGYLPYLGVGPSVLGFLPGYVQEEGLNTGAGFYLWDMLSAGLPLGGLGALPYLVFAAAVLAALALRIIFSPEAPGRYVAHAAALAFAFTVLLSPHYPWYFSWITIFLCFVPSTSLQYLTLASFLLYLIPSDTGFVANAHTFLVESAIYLPAAALALLEFRRSRAGLIKVEA